jgi:hypothetical protein
VGLRKTVGAGCGGGASNETSSKRVDRPTGAGCEGGTSGTEAGYTGEWTGSAGCGGSDGSSSCEVGFSCGFSLSV